MDPPVAAGDLSSRSRLLRSSTDHTQLLLIHYNGWPARWDEWIRGDSDRIAPFRSITRHVVEGVTGSSPSPNHELINPPRTSIRPGSVMEVAGKTEDKAGIEGFSSIIPEMARVVKSLDGEMEELGRLMRGEDKEESRGETSNVLPWLKSSEAELVGCDDDGGEGVGGDNDDSKGGGRDKETLKDMAER